MLNVCENMSNAILEKDFNLDNLSVCTLLEWLLTSSSFYSNKNFSPSFNASKYFGRFMGYGFELDS
jgi:hypothetical protein